MILLILGWVGMLMIVGSYALVSLRYLPPDSLWCSALNILGSLGVAIPAAMGGAWNVVVLQLVWILVTIVALYRRNFPSDSQSTPP